MRQITVLAPRFLVAFYSRKDMLMQHLKNLSYVTMTTLKFDSERGAPTAEPNNHVRKKKSTFTVLIDQLELCRVLRSPR